MPWCSGIPPSEATGTVPLTVPGMPTAVAMVPPTTTATQAVTCVTPPPPDTSQLTNAVVLAPGAAPGMATAMVVARENSSPEIHWTSAHVKALLELLTSDPVVMADRKKRHAGGVMVFWQRLYVRLADIFPAFRHEEFELGTVGGAKVKDKHKKLSTRYKNNYVRPQSGSGFRATQIRAQEKDKTDGLYELMEAEFASRYA